MSPALLYLLVRSARGRVLRAARRLREPRYLIGFVIGGGWIAFWFSRLIFGRFDGEIQFGIPQQFLESLSAGIVDALQLALCGVIALILTLWWLAPFGKQALEFNEAELHLLLPAPIPRRRLIQYGILRSQSGILVGALVMTFFSGLHGAMPLLRLYAGIWILLTLWDLHSKARSLWLARLDELSRGRAWRRRLLLWSALGVFWLLLLVAVTQVTAAILATPAAMSPPENAEFLTWLQNTLAVQGEAAWNSMLGWLLTPLIWLTAPLFVGFRSDLVPAAAAALWLPALAALLLHNEWVVRSQVRFEEAALARARRASRKAEPAARFWRHGTRGRSLTPFSLAPGGWPELAVIWANLMLIHRLPLRWIIWGGAGGVLTLLVLAAAVALPTWAFGIMQVAGALCLVVPPLFAGRSMRNDLRTNLLKVELIRPWPIRGWRFFLAQVSAPVLLIMLQVAAGATLLLGLEAMAQLGLTEVGGTGKIPLAQMLGVPEAVALGLLLAGVLPVALVTAALATCLENLAALAFPSWVHLGLAKKPAAAKLGQNMLVFLGLSIAMLVGLAPGLLLAGGIVAVQTLLWGVALSGWELPLLGLITAAPIGAVVAVLVGLGGQLWNRLDPSEELLAAP